MTDKRKEKKPPRRIPVRDVDGEERKADQDGSEEQTPEHSREASTLDSQAGSIVESEAHDEQSVEVEESEESGQELGLAAQLAEMTENWQRERASFQNYRRRVEQEKRDARKYACFDLALDLLRVLDYFESSVSFSENLPDEAQNVLIGVKYTVDELRRILVAHGIHPIEVGEGEMFDGELMEAVEQRETDDVAAETVIEVQRQGWLLHDRILRSAQVVVAVAPDDGGNKHIGKGGEAEEGDGGSARVEEEERSEEE